MKRRHNYLIFLIVLIFMLAGCGIKTVPEVRSPDPSDSFSGQAKTDSRQDYQITGGKIALVIDVSPLMDNGYNQAAFEGVQTYAEAAGISYSCYNTDSDTPEAYENAVLAAIQNHAELVVCAGSHFEQAAGSLQNEYNDVSFLLLDGVPKDSSGNDIAIAPNVHCIVYHEEEAGYMAGYMAVLEGYKKLGFIGGEELPSVQRYGYGYLQGIDDAAALLNISSDIRVEYWYADTFFPNRQIEEISLDWYQGGTEIIFACGGSIYESVLSSAAACGGRLIGADADQSGISELFVTSALKGIDSSVITALDEFFANGKNWPDEDAGTVVTYGAKEKCIRLPITDDAWRFKTATIDDYLQLLSRLKNDSIQITNSTDTHPKTTIAVTYHNK